MKQPVIKPNGYYCPECGEELAGSGDNQLECMNCDYSIHELELSYEHNDYYCAESDEPALPDENGNCSLCGAKLVTQKEKEFIQCGSCEQYSANPKDGNCPKCGSGNWVWGNL